MIMLVFGLGKVMVFGVKIPKEHYKLFHTTTPTLSSLSYLFIFLPAVNFTVTLFKVRSRHQVLGS